ncbi:MAG: hypothetical protein KJ952_01025 [Candidatus Omnitrophica bacterium]|nr:hypothetical protein [Candidatus Omnitrophota bacterium]
MLKTKRISLYVVFCLFISGCVATSKTVTPPGIPGKTTPVVQEKVIQESSPIAEEKVAEVRDDVQDFAPVRKEKEPITEKGGPARITHSQITNLISEIFDIQSSETLSGQPRFSGTSENNLATLEIIGEKDDVLQASVKLMYPKDVEAINIDLNNAIMLRFLRNVAPEFEDWSSRVKDIIAKFYSTEKDDRERDKITLAGKNIEILYNKESILITTKFK